MNHSMRLPKRISQIRPPSMGQLLALRRLDKRALVCKLLSSAKFYKKPAFPHPHIFEQRRAMPIWYSSGSVASGSAVRNFWYVGGFKGARRRLMETIGTT